jgi:hypothetical protein
MENKSVWDDGDGRRCFRWRGENLEDPQDALRLLGLLPRGFRTLTSMPWRVPLDLILERREKKVQDNSRLMHISPPLNTFSERRDMQRCTQDSDHRCQQYFPYRKRYKNLLLKTQSVFETEKTSPAPPLNRRKEELHTFFFPF